MKTFIATTIVAAALVPTIASANELPSRSFARDGQTYVYTATTKNTKQVIDGYVQASGSRFHLIVRNGVVSGVLGGQPVSFRVADAVTPIETASR